MTHPASSRRIRPAAAVLGATATTVAFSLAPVSAAQAVTFIEAHATVEAVAGFRVNDLPGVRTVEKDGAVLVAPGPLQVAVQSNSGGTSGNFTSVQAAVVAQWFGASAGSVELDWGFSAMQGFDGYFARASQDFDFAQVAAPVRSWGYRFEVAEPSVLTLGYSYTSTVGSFAGLALTVDAQYWGLTDAAYCQGLQCSGQVTVPLDGGQTHAIGLTLFMQQAEPEGGAIPPVPVFSAEHSADVAWRVMAAPVPEPATWVLWAVGLTALGARRLRERG
jgi:hypothetical protein